MINSFFAVKCFYQMKPSCWPLFTANQYRYKERLTEAIQVYSKSNVSISFPLKTTTMEVPVM